MIGSLLTEPIILVVELNSPQTIMREKLLHSLTENVFSEY